MNSSPNHKNQLPRWCSNPQTMTLLSTALFFIGGVILLSGSWRHQWEYCTVGTVLAVLGAAGLIRQANLKKRQIFEHDLQYMYRHVASDKNELQRINRQLEKTIRQITRKFDQNTQSSQIKSEFLAQVSHELRTPLNGIIGFADLLADGELNPQQQEYLNTIITCAQNLLVLINDVLDAAKIEAGKIHLEIKPCNLVTLIKDVHTLLIPKAKDNEIHLLVHLDDRLPEIVQTDHTRLRQCLTNLIDNAIKFTRQGHVRLIVSAEMQSQNEFVRFDVEDTGIGIAPEKLNAIFESFTQADSTTTRKYGGTGLGLAITKQLIELMGGSISVISEVNKGTVFSLRIPISPIPTESEFAKSITE